MQSHTKTCCPRLSVAMVVRDAEDRLAATLESIRKIADEIVVLDLGSSDETRLITQRYTSKLYCAPWNDHYSESRNHVWDQVSGDWVLWLEAGEQLSPASAAALRHFVDCEADVTKAYMMLVRVPAAPGQQSGQQTARIRLVPNYDSVRFSGRVREQIKSSVAAAGLALQALPWPIQSSPADTNIPAQQRNAQRDIRLAELQFADEGVTARMLVLIGESQTILGDYRAARDSFRKAITASEYQSTDMLEAFYGLLTAYENSPGEEPTQLNVCLEALQVFPVDSQLLCAVGNYLEKQGRRELAARAYQLAFEHGKIDPETWHLPEIGEIAASCAAVTFQMLSSDEQATTLLESALTAFPTSMRLRKQLIGLHRKYGRSEQADALACALVDASAAALSAKANGSRSAA